MRSSRRFTAAFSAAYSLSSRSNFLYTRRSRKAFHFASPCREPSFPRRAARCAPQVLVRARHNLDALHQLLVEARQDVQKVFSHETILPRSPYDIQFTPASLFHFVVI